MKGDFLSEPARTSVPPAIRRIPRPPAAAPAAGGRGIDGSRYVNSLGVRGGVAAGGAGAEAAATVCFWWWWSSPLPARLRVSSAADPLPRPRSRLHGVTERAPPSPELERRRFRRLTTWKVRFMAAKVVLLPVVQGGGASAPRGVAFPVAQGGLPVQDRKSVV